MKSKPGSLIASGLLLAVLIVSAGSEPTAAFPEDPPRPVVNPVSYIDGVGPNPFRESTTIEFTLSPAGADGPVRLDVLDLSGRTVARLFEGRLHLGGHRYDWHGRADNGARMGTGIYLARLTTREGSLSAKLVLLQ